MAPDPKRIRLSSPTFDDQLQQPSQDDLHAFDALDPSQRPRAPPVPAFQRPSLRGTARSLVPSAAALRDAEEKMRQWDEQDAPEPADAPAPSPPPPVFSSARNALQAPDTPTPAPLSRAPPELTLRAKPRPFRSPVVAPSIRAPPRTAVAPLGPSLAANHAKPLRFTPRRPAASRPKFVTPFKAGTTVPEHARLPVTPMARIYPPSLPSVPRSSKRIDHGRIFDLTPLPRRQTLATSGLRPQAYSASQLQEMGLNVKELGQVNLRTAPFHTFATQATSGFDRSAVLEELLMMGCTLAKQAWVDNHWPLVLWKLAGMAMLDPMSERNPGKKRWCWSEVIRQFLYRYERDLNGSSRPPLRLITTRDSPSQSPMVLCVSDVIWPADGSEDHATSVQTYPELEVTDGWYRLRARIDAPLARAVKKGKIKVGRKIAVVGAKLLAEQKEGCEILEAYNSNVFLLTGNSSHLAPWHAKLGFHRGPMIATLNSLTADGGNVAVMKLTIMKAYPVAYIEYWEDASGQKQREGPHDVKEELRLSTNWKTKRELQASKLWSEYEKRRHKLLDYAERLEQRAGTRFKPGHDDGPPDQIYDLYDDLQEDVETAKSVLSSVDHENAGWLARYIREKAVQGRDDASKEIEQELESLCPPRDVKNFCVVVVEDTETSKRPSRRTAQVTVWDVPGVSVLEGCTQSPFVPDQRYLVTNLVPTQASAWIDSPSGGEVYLTTRKNSKWTLIDH